MKTAEVNEPRFDVGDELFDDDDEVVVVQGIYHVFPEDNPKVDSYKIIYHVATEDELGVSIVEESVLEEDYSILFSG